MEMPIAFPDGLTRARVLCIGVTQLDKMEDNYLQDNNRNDGYFTMKAIR